MIKILCFVILFSFVRQANAIDIPKECRIKNENPGYCTWVSLETLGRTHKIKKLENLFENRKKESNITFIHANGLTEIHLKNYGYEYAVKAKLDKIGIQYKFQHEGNKNKDLLEKYAESHGCVFNVAKGAMPNYTNPHSLIMTDYDKTGVCFWDCNYPEKNWTATSEWLDYYWTGTVIVLLNK